jgi:hypothetical protein
MEEYCNYSHSIQFNAPQFNCRFTTLGVLRTPLWFYGFTVLVEVALVEGVVSMGGIRVGTTP